MQDPGDAGVAAIVQADASHPQAIVAEPAPARPRRQLGDGARGARRVPRRADRQGAAQPQLAPLVARAIGGEHLGRDPVSLVHRGDPARGIAVLRFTQRAHAVVGREARRRAHQGELEDLDQVVLDEEAGGLTRRVLHDLHARRRRGVAGDPGQRERAAVGDGVDGRAVPVSPDAADVDGMVGRGRVEVRARRPAPLGQAVGHVLVERRGADRHRDDPLAGLPAGRLRADDPLDVGDGAAARERGIEELEPLAVEVGVRIHEAGDDGRSPQVDHPRGAAAPARDLRAPARRGDAPIGDGERGDGGPPRIQGQDAAIDENEAVGYFIHPFSRYARSAPGCRGMPTLSGCHAVRGSNSASPAWPRTSASLFSTTVFVTV